MSEKIWIGAIYLKDEGGYEIILKSLKHYKNRLKTIENSPELKESAAMFGSILNQQAMKTILKINEVIQKIQNSLNDIKLINNLSTDIEFFEKALSCYQSDIYKAENTKQDYFIKLIGNITEAKKDVDVIKIALNKIKQYSE